MPSYDIISDFFKFNFLRLLGNFGSRRMDDDGRICRMKKVELNRRTPRKPTHTATKKIHHKTHIA